MIGDKLLRQRRFAGACLGRDCDNPPPAFARKCECIPQPSQLFIALEQVDSGPLICRKPVNPYCVPSRPLDAPCRAIFVKTGNHRLAVRDRQAQRTAISPACECIIEGARRCATVETGRAARATQQKGSPQGSTSQKTTALPRTPARA